MFQVEGQLLSLLLSIQQLSSLWQGLREALFRCCRGVDNDWLDASFQNHFPSKAQHMDDKLLYTSTTKVVKNTKNILFMTIWEEEIVYYRTAHFKVCVMCAEPYKYTAPPFKVKLGLCVLCVLICALALQMLLISLKCMYHQILHSWIFDTKDDVASLIWYVWSGNKYSSAYHFSSNCLTGCYPAGGRCCYPLLSPIWFLALCCDLNRILWSLLSWLVFEYQFL